MGQVRSIDEHFFDSEGKNPEELKKMYYVLGAFYVGYESCGESGIEFTSRSRSLVDVIKKLLNIHNHIKSSTQKGITYHSLRSKSAGKLRLRLEELGLDADKKSRTFPNDIPRRYMSHFLRGIIENLAFFYDENRKLQLSSNKGFLDNMNRVLAARAGVKRGSPKYNQIKYFHSDAARIYSFIYSDWKFVSKNGIYVQQSRDMLAELSILKPNSWIEAGSKGSAERIRRAIKLLEQGHKIGEVRKEVGYQAASGLQQAFKKKTGKSIIKYLQSQGIDYKKSLRPQVIAAKKRVERAKDFLMQGNSVSEAAELAGYSYPTGLATAFKREYAKSPSEFVRQQQQEITQPRYTSIPSFRVREFGRANPTGRREY